VDYQELGQEIKQLRKIKKISQTELAGDLNIARATISALENGGMVDVGIKKVMQILDYFGYEFTLRAHSPFPTFEELRDER
jgi:transcriptional regulator with XRE-family HTH domain